MTVIFISGYCSQDHMGANTHSKGVEIAQLWLCRQVLSCPRHVDGTAAISHLGTARAVSQGAQVAWHWPMALADPSHVPRPVE